MDTGFTHLVFHGPGGDVASMVCISPLEGWPARALASVRLIARGLPADSCWTITAMPTAPTRVWRVPQAVVVALADTYTTVAPGLPTDFDAITLVVTLTRHTRHRPPARLGPWAHTLS